MFYRKIQGYLYHQLKLNRYKNEIYKTECQKMKEKDRN